MRALGRAAAVVLVGALVAACDHPPVAGYVTAPVPPATSDASRDGEGDDAVEVAEGSATGFLFLVYDPDDATGDSVANEARSTDERVARVLPASSSGTARFGGPSYTGRVFVVVGAAAGEAEIEVSRDGAHTGRVGVRVLPQDP
jgi:hypothetical protein